jgi:ABC-type multidrug transport system ATPase subunit
VQVGYCPQRDPLLELLTPREHLQLYARIKGVPEKNLLPVVEAKLRVNIKTGRDRSSQNADKELIGYYDYQY